MSGAVFWITGLSGAGKTTIGKLLFDKIKAVQEAAVFLDGDSLRQVFGDDLGYSPADRFKSAMRNARLCKMLSEQGITVVCATISMFHDCRKWNRENIDKYREIYIRVSLDVLKKRNQKGLYQGTENVVGVNLDFEEPIAPDLILDNVGDQDPKEISEKIYSSFVSGGK